MAVIQLVVAVAFRSQNSVCVSTIGSHTHQRPYFHMLLARPNYEMLDSKNVTTFDLLVLRDPSTISAMMTTLSVYNMRHPFRLDQACGRMN